MVHHLLLVGIDQFPNTCCTGTTYERTDDEDPEIRQCRSTLEDGRSDGAGRVHGCSRVTDTYQMDENQRQTDGQTSEVVGGTIGLGRSTQHDEHEDTGEDDLCQQTTEHRHINLEVIGTRTLQSGHILRQDNIYRLLL